MYSKAVLKGTRQARYPLATILCNSGLIRRAGGGGVNREHKFGYIAFAFRSSAAHSVRSQFIPVYSSLFAKKRQHSMIDKSDK